MENKLNNEMKNDTQEKGFARVLPMIAVMEEESLGLEYSFDRVRIPTGSGTNLILPPKADGEPNEIPEMAGVILHSHPENVYFSSRYTDENNPPDCTSIDGINGIGYPGGDCRICPYNRFGSGRGRNKLCKNRRRLYLLREGDLFPVMISLPTRSLKSYADYVKAQIMQGRKPSALVTGISVRTAVSQQGEAYPTLKFTFKRMLEAEEQEVIACATNLAKAYVEKHKLLNVTIDPETGEVMDGMM